MSASVLNTVSAAVLNTVSASVLTKNYTLTAPLCASLLLILVALGQLGLHNTMFVTLYFSNAH